jgi:hypothetical protein
LRLLLPANFRGKFKLEPQEVTVKLLVTEDVAAKLSPQHILVYADCREVRGQKFFKPPVRWMVMPDAPEDIELTGEPPEVIFELVSE